MEHSAQEIWDVIFDKSPNKNPKEISGVINILFGSPKIFLERIRELAGKTANQNESELDVSLIVKMYENINVNGRDKQVCFCFNKAFDEFEAEGGLKKFLKSSTEMKYFFIVILWEKLFDPENKITLYRALDLIIKSQYTNIFTRWLNDLSANQITMLIAKLQEIIEEEVELWPQPQQQEQGQSKQKQKINFKQVKKMCQFLTLLYQSNKDKHRVAPEFFESKAICEIFEPVEQFKLFLKKQSDGNFLKYPFLLDFEFKYKLIQIQSIYEQKMSIRNTMQKGLSSLMQSINLNSNFSIEGLIYLHFTVNRQNILDDSMAKLDKINNLKSPLKIAFVGEEGADEGGVKNQYFQLVTKSIFNPYLDMFLPKNQGRFYWINGFSYEIPLRFQFVGMLLGLSIYNSVHLDIHFPDVIYKKLLNKTYEEDYSLDIVEDLKEIQPEIYKGLKHILTTEESLEGLELYFNIELDDLFGEKRVEELVQEGNFIKVCQDNKQEYCLEYANYYLNKHIQKQFNAFKRGFYRVVSGGVIEIFETYQLRNLIGGIEQIDIKELQQSTFYEGGYTSNTPIIKDFWQIANKFNLEEKKAFLIFVTGTDRVPIDGLKSLKFLIQRHSNTENLPTAHTCFNVFLLPEYEHKSILERNIKLILQNNQGFGLI